jgi:oxygen-dependent protoporphyrinogen oxidase
VSRRYRVLVLGGGISGLTVAHGLLRQRESLPVPLEVFVLEPERRPGGSMKTDLVDGYVVEWGPNGFLDREPATLDLARELSLETSLLRANRSAEKRYLFRGGRLRLLPMSPGAFLTSDVLSPAGRLRVLLEPLVPPRRVDHGEDDESVLDFASRRIGREAATVLVDAMVSGIYAGDAAELELRSTFPRMQAMERDHGGLFRAMLAMRKAKRMAAGASARAGGPAGTGGPATVGGSPRVATQAGDGGPTGPGGTLTSFPKGMETLIRELALHLGDSLRTGVDVRYVLAGGSAASREYWVRVDGDPGPMPEDFRLRPGVLRADAIVVATPAHRADDLLREMDPALAQELHEIPYAGLAVVSTAYRLGDLRSPLDGFGFLVPRREGLRILGSIWVSSIFPPHAPGGFGFLRTMIGGAHDPDAVGLPDEGLLAITASDLERTMGLRATPVFTRIHRQPKGIPQYVRGHGSRLAGIHDALTRYPGFYLAGNAYRGIGLNDCIREGRETVKEILELARGVASR